MLVRPENIFPPDKIQTYRRVLKENYLLRRPFGTSNLGKVDCFRLLGLAPGSDETQIKAAFRNLAKTNHPDLGGSTERFVKIQQAYERLMDPEFRKDERVQTSSDSRDGKSSYWRAWETGSSWWSSGTNRYSTEADFDADFEDQWRRYSEKTRSTRGRKFRAKNGGKTGETRDDTDENRESHDRSDSGSSERSRGGRERRRDRKRSSATDIPDAFRLSAIDSLHSTLNGDFVRISDFNGRACFHDRSRFIFWSNKNKDWKISEILKDDGNCLAFSSRVHPSLDWPFVIGDPSKWMVWNERYRRYVSAKIRVETTEENFASWSVEKLRETLLAMGLEEKVAGCFEKSELIDLMEQFADLRRSKTRAKPSSNDHIPEGQFRLCSRQRHDGVVQAPPVLSDSCKTGKNRVEPFIGFFSQLEEWLVRHGDRRRFYGVFDSDRNYCFGLIWKNNKQWARAGKYDW
jgi:curved DNA-binding protein CbpA